MDTNAKILAQSLVANLASSSKPTDQATIEGDLFDNQCPTRTVLDRIGDKWSVLVLLILQHGRMRFTDLKNEIGGVTPKVLTQTLRTMERDGLLIREVYAEVPPRVEYQLTELGHSLHDAVLHIASWAQGNVANILTARENFDQLKNNKEK